MSQASRIEWTEATWNPTVGCTKISPGCKHCYAETMAKRLQAMGTPGYENGFRLTILSDRLAEPLARKKPTVYFVNSMSDLFHKGVDDGYIAEVFDVIAERHARIREHVFRIDGRLQGLFGHKTAIGERTSSEGGVGALAGYIIIRCGAPASRNARFFRFRGGRSWIRA